MSALEFTCSEDGFDPMVWATPQFSRSKVDKAGFVIAEPTPKTLDEIFEQYPRREEAFSIVNNWRSSHSYPLNTFQITLRKKASKFGQEFVVAQRIKRLESIRSKLTRDETRTLQLSQMQDIGGCRAILKDVKTVRKVRQLYDESRFAHKFVGQKDYIDCPKEDGYRGIHLIYQYVGKGPTEVYNKLRIEVQLRSLNQHAWATAVEAVSTFTDQALKWRMGQKEWRRFFALMGSAIALIEKCPIVPGTPENPRDLITELSELSTKLNVQEVMQMYKATINFAGQAKDAKYLLLELDPKRPELKVTRFTARDSQEANKQYLEAERQVQDGSSKQVVLVSVDSLSKLQKAYPNYFMDTDRFSHLLTQVLLQQAQPA